MILIDTNLLLYATLTTLPHHRAANQWLTARFSGADSIGLPWGSLLGFVRLASNSRLFSSAIPMQTAWNRVQEWLELPTTWIPEPTPRHAELLGAFFRIPGMRFNMVPDAHLAALAVEHGLTVCSTDADFGRFPGVRWINPIAGQM